MIERGYAGVDGYKTALPSEVLRMIDSGESPERITGFYDERRAFLDDIENLIAATEE